MSAAATVVLSDAALGKALSLAIDSALAAHDALSRADPVGIVPATDALVANALAAKELALAWVANHE